MLSMTINNYNPMFAATHYQVCQPTETMESTPRSWTSSIEALTQRLLDKGRVSWNPVSGNIWIYNIIIHYIYIYYLRAAAPAADPGRMVNEWNQIGINILRCFALLGFPLFHIFLCNIFDKIFWYSKKTHPPNPFTPLSSSSTTSTRMWVLSSWNYSFY